MSTTAVGCAYCCLLLLISDQLAHNFASQNKLRFSRVRTLQIYFRLWIGLHCAGFSCVEAISCGNTCTPCTLTVTWSPMNCARTRNALDGVQFSSLTNYNFKYDSALLALLYHEPVVPTTVSLLIPAISVSHLSLVGRRYRPVSQLKERSRWVIIINNN